MDEPPGGNSVSDRFSKTQKRREHRKRHTRSVITAAKSRDAASSLLSHDRQRSSDSEEHRQHLLRLETRHSLELSVQAAKAEPDAAAPNLPRSICSSPPSTLLSGIGRLSLSSIVDNFSSRKLTTSWRSPRNLLAPPKTPLGPRPQRSNSSAAGPAWREPKSSGPPQPALG